MMSDDRFSSGEASSSTRAAQPGDGHDVMVIAVETLMRGRKEVQISHRGDIYRLRITSRGKLILHK